MSDTKPSKNLIRPKDDNEFSSWQLPDVTEAQKSAPANLFGHTARVTHVQEEIEHIQPPTMAEIEQMRAEAEAEGFEEGKQQGYQAGLEQGRLEGLEQGHNEGFKQGQQQGVDEGLTQAKSLVLQFEALMAQFDKPLNLLDTEIEMTLINLAMGLAKAVVGNELKTHPEHILAALRQGVDALPIKEQAVTVRVHPSDAELINRFYTQAQLERHKWQLDEDPILSPGDCILTSQRSEVDLRLSSRLTAVLSELTEQASYLAQQADTQKLAIDEANEQKQAKDVRSPVTDIDSADTSCTATLDPLRTTSIEQGQASSAELIDEGQTPDGDANAQSPTPTAE